MKSFLFLIFLLPAAVLAQPTDSVLAQYLSQWRNHAHEEQIEVGVFSEGEVTWYSFYKDTLWINQPSVGYFEIGSISKPLMGLALHHAWQQEGDFLDRAVADYLPDSVGWPLDEAKPILFQHLVTHASGLPRMPANVQAHAPNPFDPYAKYEPGHMMEFLQEVAPSRAPGEEFEYSNLGAGLAVFLTARHENKSVTQWTEEHLLMPWGLHEIGYDIPDSLMVLPWQPSGYKSIYWHWTDALSGAGGLRATPQGIMDLLRKLISPSAEQASLLTASTAKQFAAHSSFDVATFWLLQSLPTSSHKAIWHNGRTMSFESFIGWVPENQQGLVILCNTTPNMITELGLRWLDVLSKEAE